MARRGTVVIFAAVCGRAVCRVPRHRGGYVAPWAAIGSIAAKIGCSGGTLRGGVRQAERGSGERAGTAGEEGGRAPALEREKRELRQANAILRKARACFARAELAGPMRASLGKPAGAPADRRCKP
jgi:transposase-like protein